SEKPKAEPDLKVFVELKNEPGAGTTFQPRFVGVQEIEGCRADLEKAKADLQQEKQAAQSAIAKGISHFVSNVRFPYRFEAGKPPFFVRAMYHDERFTYIQARPEETPTLYEMKDKQPSLVSFDYKDGVYVVDKILGRGY